MEVVGSPSGVARARVIGAITTRLGRCRCLSWYYKEQQLLTATRTAGGQRHYPDGAVERVRLIQQLYAAGLGSKAIVDLLPCVYTGVATPEMVTRIATERDRIDHQVQERAQTRDRLDAVIATAERSHHIPCVQEPAQPR